MPGSPLYIRLNFFMGLSVPELLDDESFVSIDTYGELLDYFKAKHMDGHNKGGYSETLRGPADKPEIVEENAIRLRFDYTESAVLNEESCFVPYPHGTGFIYPSPGYQIMVDVNDGDIDDLHIKVAAGVPQQIARPLAIDKRFFGLVEDYPVTLDPYDPERLSWEYKGGDTIKKENAGPQGKEIILTGRVKDEKPSGVWRGIAGAQELLPDLFGKGAGGGFDIIDRLDMDRAFIIDTDLLGKTVKHADITTIVKTPECVQRIKDSINGRPPVHCGSFNSISKDCAFCKKAGVVAQRRG